MQEFKVVGLRTRTNNNAERDPLTAKIGPLIQKYMQLVDTLSYLKNPEAIYSVYTDYESDFTGEYTYLIGQKVNALEEISGELTTLTIPSQEYIKFTNGPGAMPNVCVDIWQKVWKMPDQELGGERAYRADFEVYKDMKDPQNQIVSVYVGVES